MHIQHQPMLPFSYYDKHTGKIILKLITDSEIIAVKLIYGDPFAYRKTDRLNHEGHHIWDWEYHEAPLLAQYTSHESTMWRIAITPLKTKRMKYAFIVTTQNGQNIYYGEKGTQQVPHSSEEMHNNIFFFPFVHAVDALHVPSWARDICWYQIFPERFCNGNASISPANTKDWETGTPKPDSFFGGDLHGIIQKLPYLHELGITGIYLTPIFVSPSNHKYNTQDYFKIDPCFGDTETLKALVSKAHALGMKVMLDAVFNHIGSTHPFWLDVLANQEKSKYKDYFHIHSFPVKEKYQSQDNINYDTFAFVPHMPKWNTENPEARQYLLDIAQYWIKECDIDGWRLDVSDEVSFDFWNCFKQAVRIKPDFYILGEVWHDPSKWLNGQYFDAVMNYTLGNAIKELFISKTIDPDTFTQEIFAKLMRASDAHNSVRFNLLDSHDTARILTQANGDKLAVKNAFMFMFMMKGAPSVYYGTEIGMEGGNDPDCRRPMIWDAKKQDLELAGFFKQLIILRKTYNELVQNADITYTKDNGLCRWSLRHGASRLDIVYNAGDNGLPLPLTGSVHLSTGCGFTGILGSGVCAIEVIHDLPK